MSQVPTAKKQALLQLLSDQVERLSAIIRKKHIECFQYFSVFFNIFCEFTSKIIKNHCNYTV
jgi:hypothetical protein